MGLIDTHVHTCWSDGLSSPREVVDFARLQTDLTLLAITDHDTIEGALRAAEYACGQPGAPAVVVGEEISTLDGHVLGLGLERTIPPGRSAAWTVEAIHKQGGVAIAAHPFWRTARQVAGRGEVMGAGMLVCDLPFDALEVANGMPLLHLHNRRASEVASVFGLIGTGGSDSHVAEAVTSACTAFSGSTFDDFKSALAAGEVSVLRRPVLARSLLAIARHAARGRWFGGRRMPGDGPARAERPSRRDSGVESVPVAQRLG